MNNAAKEWILFVILLTTLWLGGCASSNSTVDTHLSSAGTIPRVDASALIAPRTSPPPTSQSLATTNAGPALLPVVARNTLANTAAAVYREPALSEPTPRRRSTQSRSTRRQQTATAATTPTPADEPAPPVPEVETDRVSNGRYHWNNDANASGAVKVVVNLGEQQAYVYRGDALIGQSSVSTGRQGHRTPTGSFEILQKKRRHTSNIYDGAKMPYMQRLTWDGIALHGGDLPGYPASHGCIRLPMGFAKKLFQTTEHGTQVVVTQG